MPADRSLDEATVTILNLLQSDGRISQAELSKQVGLAPSAVLERLRKLEASGTIREYVARIDPRAAGRPLLAFIAVRTTEHGKEMPSAVTLSRIPDVLEVHHVAGEDCYLLKVRARDAEHLGQLLRTQIASVPGVTSTRTTIVLETMKESTRVPLPDGDHARPARRDGRPAAAQATLRRRRR